MYLSEEFGLCYILNFCFLDHYRIQEKEVTSLELLVEMKLIFTHLNFSSCND